MREPFQNRSFRRLFAGRIVTNVGDSLYFIAAMWLVYSLTGDPFYTGLAGFLTMTPRVFQFLAGPLVDRWPIRRTLVGTQLCQAIVISTIPIAHAFDLLTVGHVLVVMPVLSALNQLVYPAQIAALPRILEDEELVAANSAFSVAYQGLDMVANGVGGVLIGFLGAVALFAIDAVTFAIAAVIFATLSIPSAHESEDDGDHSTRELDDPGGEPIDGHDDGPRRGRQSTGVAADRSRDSAVSEPVADGGCDGDSSGDSSSDTVGESSATVDDSGDTVDDSDGDESTSTLENRDGSEEQRETDEPTSYVCQLREGVAVIRGTFLVPLIGSVIVANFAAGIVLATIPPYADTLALPASLSAIGGAGAYGLLMAAFAAGTFLGAMSASRVAGRPLGRTLVVGFTLTGSLWTAGLLVDWLPATALLFALAVVPIGVINVQVAAVVQSAPPNELVGRVSSLNNSAASALFPIGALVGGVVAGALGPRVALSIFGLVTLATAAYVLVRSDLRRIPAPAETSLDGETPTGS